MAVFNGLFEGLIPGLGNGTDIGTYKGAFKGLHDCNPYVFQIETMVWRNQLSNPKPSTTYLQRIDTLIRNLKEAGIWSQLDRFWVFATEQQSHAKISLVNPNGINAPWPSGIIENNSPTWTRLKGYTGNGTNMYLNTQYIAKNSGLVSSGNISYMVYCVSNNTETAGSNVEFGNINKQVVPAAGTNGTLYDGTNSEMRVNCGSTITSPSSGARGTWAMMTGPTNLHITVYKNGIGTTSSIIQPGDSSGGTDNQSMYVLAANNLTGNTASEFSTQQLSMFGAGTAKINQTVFYNLFNKFVLQNQL